MKNKSIYIKYGILVILSIIIIPIIIDHLIIGNNFPSNIDNSEWVSFLGSYTGALIGSATTLIGILITLNFTMKQNNEERRLGLAPYFKYTMHEKTLLSKKSDIDIFHMIDKNANTYVNATLTLKNIGMGPVLDMKVYNISFKDKDVGYEIDGSNDILESGSELLMLIDLRLRLDEIDNDRLIKNPSGSLLDYSPPFECLQKGGVLSMCIGYTDLIGNKYEQIIKFSMSISCESKTDGCGWKYSKPELRISNIEKSKIMK